MKNLTRILFVALLGVSALAVQAQKFGYINSQELMMSLPEVKEANANIEQLNKDLVTKRQNMIQELQTKYADLESRASTIAPVQLQEEANALKAEEQKIVEFEQKSSESIYKKSEQLIAPIQEKVNNALKAVASENGYAYIFDAANGFVLYADEGTDVTELVKAKL